MALDGEEGYSDLMITEWTTIAVLADAASAFWVWPLPGWAREGADVTLVQGCLEIGCPIRMTHTPAAVATGEEAMVAMDAYGAVLAVERRIRSGGGGGGGGGDGGGGRTWRCGKGIGVMRCG